MVDWIDTVPVDALPDEGGKLFSYLDKRIALFRTPAGVYAADNRCPHEGYALKDGDIRGDVLTCAWHNWKFRLTDGTVPVRRGEHPDATRCSIREGGCTWTSPIPRRRRSRRSCSRACSRPWATWTPGAWPGTPCA